MKKVVLIIILFFSIIFISGCAEKECETATDCANKTCSDVDCKDYKCVYSAVSDCCGNDACEVGETYEDCVVDCPDCDDVNECTIDSYDYHKEECINKAILDVVCCGNGLCEIGETYESCTRDCPNCDDENKCTKDLYDYHKQKCINKVVIPCCGNEICDQDTETFSNCPGDCPNCDDDNKLTKDIFNYETQECKNTVTHYFIDDFEGDIKSWTFSDERSWSTEVEDSNTYLRGVGVVRANLQKELVNYIFKFRFKRMDGSMHVDFRRSSTENGSNRYFVAVSKSVYSLNKQVGDDFQVLKDIDFRLDKDWHTLEVRSYDNIINVYIDDELITKYKDTENPLLSGWVRFELHTGGVPEMQPEFLIDDVEIKVITEEDIIYP